MAEEKRTTIIDFQINDGEAIVSIENLTKANKALRDERNKLNLATEAGLKRSQEINSLIDRNTNAIKNNSSAIEKQRANIGNYSESIKTAAGQLGNMAGKLDAVVPGLGAMGSGLTSITQASRLFIATPLGAVIGAIGLALGALISFFKSTGEGEDKLTAITKTAGVVWEKFKRVIEGVGGAVSWLLDKLGLVSEEGQALADLDDQIDEANTALITKRAETENKVAKLRAEALRTEGEAKKKLIEEAIKLERDLADEEMNLSKMRVKQFEEEHKTKKDLTDEEKRQYIELKAAVIGADTAAYNNTLRFEKEIEAIKKEIHEAEVERLNEINAIRRANSEGVVEEETEIQEQIVEIKSLAELATFENMQASLKRTQEADKKANEAKLKAAIKTQKEQTRITELEEQNRLATISAGIGQAQALFAENTVAYKFLGVARATIDTYRAADLALASIPPPFGAIAAGVNIALGLANVAKILDVGVTAAAGGGSFMTKGPQLLMVGDNPGGVERVDVTPVSGRGKTVVGKNMVQMAGGGTMFTDASIVANSSQFSPSQQSVTVNMVYSEFREFQEQVLYKEQVAQA